MLHLLLLLLLLRGSSSILRLPDRGKRRRNDCDRDGGCCGCCGCGDCGCELSILKYLDRVFDLSFGLTTRVDKRTVCVQRVDNTEFLVFTGTTMSTIIFGSVAAMQHSSSI
jgi:hypothetical protein